MRVRIHTSNAQKIKFNALHQILIRRKCLTDAGGGWECFTGMIKWHIIYGIFQDRMALSCFSWPSEKAYPTVLGGTSMELSDWERRGDWLEGSPCLFLCKKKNVRKQIVLHVFLLQIEETEVVISKNQALISLKKWYVYSNSLDF